MKKTLALVLVLAMVLCAVPAFAAMTEITYCVPRTVECLEDSPFHIAKALLAEQGITMNIQETFGTTDTKMVATNQAQFCGPGPFYVLSAIAEGLPIQAIVAYDAINIWGMAVPSDSPIKSFDDMIGAQEKYGRKLTVALGDPSWEGLVTPTLIAAGVDIKNDLEFVVAGENRYVQVAEKKLDMLFSWPGETWQLIGQNYDFVYIDGNDILKTNSNPLCTSLYMIENEPDTVRAFVEAMQQATPCITTPKPPPRSWRMRSRTSRSPGRLPSSSRKAACTRCSAPPAPRPRLRRSSASASTSKRAGSSTWKLL